MSWIGYFMIAAVALVCAVLLMIGYGRNGVRLLLWGSLCFFGLTITNAILVFEIALLNSSDLFVSRLIVTATSLSLLIYGCIWDAK